MTIADIVLTCLLLIGVIIGFRQGFLLELFSLAAIVLGVIGGFKLMGHAIVLLDAHFDINETILPYLAFAIVFIAIVIAVRVAGKLLKSSLDKTFLGTVDRAAGAAIGLVKAVFMISVTLWLLDALDVELPDSWTADSWLLPRIESFAPAVADWIAGYVPFLSDVFT